LFHFFISDHLFETASGKEVGLSVCLEGRSREGKNDEFNLNERASISSSYSNIHLSVLLPVCCRSSSLIFARLSFRKPVFFVGFSKESVAGVFE